MKFHYPFDPATGEPGDGSVAWTNGDPATGTDGSIPPAEVYNDVQAELAHLIDHALGDGTFGDAQDEDDLEQVRKAVAAMITAGATPIPDRLGETAKLVTDWDTATTNGWYRAANGASNAPDTGQFLGYVEALTATYCTQTVHGVVIDGEGDTRVWRRGYDNGVWSAWYQLRLSADEQEAVYLDLANMTGTLSTSNMPMASQADAEAATLLARVMSPLRTKQFVDAYLGALGPDDVGSRMHCGVNTTAFVVGASFAGTSLHPSSSRTSSPLAAGGSSGGTGVAQELGTAVLSGTWEALVPSEGTAGSNVTRWAEFIKVSD